MIFVILQEAASRGELILVENGLLRWKKRKRDGVVVIHEILVQPWAFRRGVGKEMVRQVLEKNPGCDILARCPISYESNHFWESIGFINEGEIKGLNQWWLRCGSSAPTETPRTFALPMRPDGPTASDCPPEESCETSH